jgi:Trk K+ transport system NAD-binding subunit
MPHSSDRASSLDSRFVSSSRSSSDRSRPPSSGGHVIVCGTDHLGRRIVEELLLRHEQVVAIARSEADAADVAGSAARIVLGDYRRESTLREAHAETADAIVFANDDDLANLNAALAAHEINPKIRLVIRMFDAELGSHLPALFPEAVTISSSAVAAPGFVSAAIDGEAGERFELAGKLLTAHTTASDQAPDPIAPANPAGVRSIPIARLRADRTVDILPDAATDESGLIVIDVTDPPATKAVEAKGGASSRAVGRIDGRRLGLTGRRWQPPSVDERLIRLAVILLAIVAVSAVFFGIEAGLSPLDALSYAITLLTGVSLPVSVPDVTPIELKIYAILLSVGGAAIVAVLYALITDAIVRSRLLQTLGRRSVPPDIHDHVIVCGLGSIGYRVALGLVERGMPVVVVEPDENGRFVAAARAVGIPVVVGDARQKELLIHLGLERCRALVAATSDDLVNLSAALNARSVRANLRVVVRLFDPDFAVRVQRGFHIRFTRSVSHLAAPAFAAAALGSEVLMTIPVGDRRVVLVSRVRVAEGSALVGRTVGSLDGAGTRRVLALLRGWDEADETAGETTWLPRTDRKLEPNEDVVFAATRAGLAEMLALARTATNPIRA